MDGKHYFTDNRDLPSRRRDITYFFGGREYRFTTDDGVFSKSEVDYGTHTLLKAVAEDEPLISGSVFDMGCGYGVIAVVLKGTWPDLQVTAGDVNPRALELTALNSEQNHAPVTAVESDGLAALGSAVFSAIITNPPIRAGKKTVYRMFDEAYAHLSEGGVFYAVIRRNQGAESAMNKLAELFGSCDLIDRDRGYWVLRCIRQ